MDIKGKIGQVKDLDWKRLLLEKGEKIGLCVAGAFAGLMLLPFLWYLVAGNGPSANARQLDEPTAQLDQKQKVSQPSDADKPPPGETQVVVKNLKINDPTPYQMAQLTSGSGGGDPTKRKQPTISTIEEGTAAVAWAQIWSYVFDQKVTKISVVKDSTAVASKVGPGGGDKKGMGRYNPYGKGGMPSMPSMPGMAGGPGGAGRPGMGMIGRPGGMGMGGPPRMGAPPMMGGGEGLKKDLMFEFIPLEQFNPDQPHQEKIQPVRMVVIAAAFPYRQQMEEFQRKLNLTSSYAVRDDVSGELDPTTKTPMPAFRFLGVNVERQTLDADGNPIGGWEKVDLNGAFKPYLFANGRRFEEEPEGLDPIAYPGIVMPRLKAANADQYPKIETTLPKIKETLDEIKKRTNPILTAPKNPLKLEDDFDIWNAKPKDNEGSPGGPGGDTVGISGPGGGKFPPAGMPGGPGGKFPPAGMPGAPGGKFPPAGMPGAPGGPKLPGGGLPGTGDGRPGGGDYPGATGADDTPPDYCLVRVIDLTVFPGTTYRYRMQVKMANPNKNLKNVLSPKYAQDPYLLSDWFELKDNVVVPPETFFYAIDQKDPLVEVLSLDQRVPPKERDYKGQNHDYVIQKDRQAVFQMHKWLHSMPLPNDDRQTVEVGEWVVAERVPVFRGEYLGRNQRVQVPVWKSTQESFVLMTDPKNTQSQRYPGVPVNFSQPDGSDLVLVDFEGGEVKYDRGGGKPVVSEKAATEVMVLSPDGKLLVHESVADAKDPERIDRLKAYRTRVKDVKSGKANEKTSGGGTDPANPFGGGGKPGGGDGRQ